MAIVVYYVYVSTTYIRTNVRSQFYYTSFTVCIKYYEWIERIGIRIVNNFYRNPNLFTQTRLHKFIPAFTSSPTFSNFFLSFFLSQNASHSPSLPKYINCCQNLCRKKERER